MAIQTVLTTDQLIVTGPPSSVNVRVDVGDPGPRGNTSYFGFGDPNTNTTFYTSSNIPTVGDLYINRELGSDYGVLYRLNAVPGGTSWQSVLKFQPIAYSVTSSVSFLSGSGTLSIPLQNIYFDAPENLDPNSILLQLNSNYNNPLLLSVSKKTIIENDFGKVFIAELKAAEFYSGDVSSLSGSPFLDIFVTSGVRI
jgi:hypothetical protein